LAEQQKYKRLTPTLGDRIKELEAKNGSQVGIHDDDEKMVEIPLGWLRELENLVEYCEIAHDPLMNLLRIRQVFDKKASMVDVPEGFAACSMDEAIQYLIHLSNEKYAKKEV
jgi:hypothetical protein